MKKIITLLLVFTFGLGYHPLQAVVDIKPVNKEAAKSQKELRKAEKREKKIEKMEKMLEKAQKKADRKAKKKKGAMEDGGLSGLDKNLRLAIIFAIAAVAASIVAAIISSLWILPSVLWLVALVFLILWLINDA